MNKTIKDLRKLNKNQLVYAVYQLENTHKQTITDHAMELSNLRELLEVEKKSVEHWKNQANDQERARKNLSNELQKTVSDNHNQEQIIRKLGDSLALAGEAIAHL